MFQAIILYCSIIVVSFSSLTESLPGAICTYYEDVSKVELCPGETIYIETSKCFVSETELKNTITEKVAKKSASTKENINNLKKNLTATTEKCLDFRKNFAKDCDELATLGVRTSGVYNITVGKKTTEVYCDMETDGGGWTVIQLRTSNNVDFFRNWTFYKNGFGILPSNFWLGLDNIHAITSSRSYQLRVDLQDFSNNTVYALYRNFSISDENLKYKLHVGGFSGSAGDSLKYHNKMRFTTLDRDNDNYRSNCAKAAHGAWWYKDCYRSNLNGKYVNKPSNSYISNNWFTWKDNNVALKRTEMKIKPN